MRSFAFRVASFAASGALACLLIATTALRLLAQAPAQNTPPPGQLPLPSAPPPVPQASKHGTVERIKVHGQSLEGNLEGDSPDRDVSVYLPPSYATDRHRRYPVIYLLHGYMDNDINWFGAHHIFVNAPGVLDAVFSDGSAREMIVVMPSAYTVYYGSMYSNSVATGDWEDFIARDLVSYVDAHYRTIPNRMSRGLGGHSMGGYGTIRLGMKFPDVFSSLYAMSACCLAPNASFDTPAMAKAQTVKSAADLAQLDFPTRAAVASAAAWSPDPTKSPLYYDLPLSDGKVQPLIAAQWDANAPLAMVPQYVSSLKQYHAIALDVGTKDSLMASIQDLDSRLTLFGIAHTLETYDGTHVSGIQMRLEKNVLPFFSQNLSFEASKR